MIVTVVGARPQFVKAAIVSSALARCGVQELLVHTGQHYDDAMSGVFWRELGLPGIDLNLAVGSGPHGRQTGQIMERLEAYLLTLGAVRGMLVYGDTNSTLAAALVAAKLDIPVLHVEAGLRSFDRRMPEEINRCVTDQLSTLLFCPSEVARAHLEREGITGGVSVVGDVMYDAFLAFSAKADPATVTDLWPTEDAKRVLLTLHRPSNADVPARLAAIVAALDASGANVVWPVHPRVSGGLAALESHPRVRCVEPLSYLQMLAALRVADLVVTDSGGLQKEAYWSKTRCVTLRRETEWVETMRGDWNTLAPDPDDLGPAMRSEVKLPWEPLYGDGAAAQHIATQIAEFLR